MFDQMTKGSFYGTKMTVILGNAEKAGQELEKMVMYSFIQYLEVYVQGMVDHDCYSQHEKCRYAN